MVTERRERIPRAQREQQMLAAAERLFGQRGYHATSMEEVAAAVGVTKPMLYEYFGSKEGLLLAGIRRIRAELLERTVRSVQGVSSPEEALRRGLRTFFDYIDGHTQSWAMLRQEFSLTEGPAAAEVEAIRREQATWISSAVAGFAGGAASGRAREFAAYAEAIVGAAERLAIWRAGHPEVTPEDATGYLMTFAWAGLRSLIPDGNRETGRT